MPVIVDTVGATDANSYLSVAAATELLDARLGSGAWASADPDDQARALIMATRDIDSNRFRGYKVAYDQALQFPRTDQPDTPPDQIPQDVLLACAEQALWCIQNAGTGGRSDRQKLQSQGVTQYTVGNLSETFRGGSFFGGGVCPEGLRYLQGYIMRTGRLVGPRDQALYEDGQQRWHTGPFAPWP